MPYSKQELLNKLVECYENEGTTSEAVLNDPSNDYPTQPTYNNHFGSLNNARRKAGLPVIRQSQQWTKDDVIKEINSIYEKEGYFTSSMMEETDGPNPSSIYTHFDSVSEAITEAGLDADRDTRRLNKWNTDELLQYLRECYEIYGKCTISIINNDDYFPSSGAYQYHFESFSEAKEQAGLSQYEKRASDYYKYTAPELIDALKSCHNEGGSTLYEDILSHDDCPTPAVYTRRFGSLSNAREIADIPEPIVDYNQRTEEWSSDKLLELLRQFEEQHGDTRTSTLNEYGPPTSAVYINRFGSLETARELADCKRTNYITHERWQEIVGDIENLDGYDSTADGYVYVLQVDLDGEEAYYVGQTVNPIRRLKNYIIGKPRARWNKQTPFGKVSTNRDEYTNISCSVVDVLYVVSMYKGEGESEETFRRRRLERERKESFTVALDKNTTNVFGGR